MFMRQQRIAVLLADLVPGEFALAVDLVELRIGLDDVPREPARARAPSCSCRGSGRPVELLKVDLVSPSSRARVVISSANSSSLPAMPSASAMQASLPDWMMTPRSRSSTFTRLWIGANMVERARRRAALAPGIGADDEFVVELEAALLDLVEHDLGGHQLGRLAGATSSSAFFSNRTVPLSASIRIAVGAAGVELALAARRGRGAAQPRCRHASRPATTPRRPAPVVSGWSSLRGCYGAAIAAIQACARPA